MDIASGKLGLSAVQSSPDLAIRRQIFPVEQNGLILRR